MVGVEAAQQEDLDFATGLVAMADQAGRHDACVIENQRIAGHEVLLEVVEMVVADGFLHRVEHHEARGVARLDWRLCDALLRQVIVKIG